MSEGSNMDKFFNKKFDKHSEKGDMQAGWESMQKRLDEEMPEKKPPSRGWLLGALAVLLITGILLWPDRSDEELLTESQTEAADTYEQQMAPETKVVEPQTETDVDESETDDKEQTQAEDHLSGLRELHASEGESTRDVLTTEPVEEITEDVKPAQPFESESVDVPAPKEQPAGEEKLAPEESVIVAVKEKVLAEETSKTRETVEVAEEEQGTTEETKQAPKPAEPPAQQIDLREMITKEGLAVEDSQVVNQQAHQLVPLKIDSIPAPIVDEADTGKGKKKRSKNGKPSNMGGEKLRDKLGGNLMVQVGVNMSPGISNDNSGKFALAPGVQLGYYMKLHHSLFLALEVGYQRLSGDGLFYAVDSVKYGLFRETISQEVRIIRREYIRVPISLFFKLNEKHKVHVGFDIAFLMNTLSERGRSVQSPVENNTTELSKERGFQDGILDLSQALNVGYEYQFAPKLSVGINLRQGIRDITDDTWFKNEDKDLPTAGRIYLRAKLWKDEK